MTMNKMTEIISSKIGALRGEFINASAHRKFNPNDFAGFLQDMGYDASGKETLYSPKTGEALESQIYMGPCYYQVLKHNVLDKIQARGRGAKNVLTRQPIRGRALRGGLRLGNMERIGLISHGARWIANERLCTSSDAYRAVYCRKCGVLAVSDTVLTKQISCRNCRSTDKNDMGVCQISYVTHYLNTLLLGTGINVRFGFSEKEKIESREDFATLEEVQEEEEEMDREQGELDQRIIEEAREKGQEEMAESEEPVDVSVKRSLKGKERAVSVGTLKADSVKSSKKISSVIRVNK
jgi:hypothetical protein